MLDELIQAELSHLVEIRRDLHAHPQLAFNETYASELVQRELKSAGVACEAGIAKTGVVGWIGEGPGVGLRADMDALPITEQTGLPYASQNAGCMHACGHDGHTTMLIGAARVLAKMPDDLPRPGGVKFVFQPAEEVEGGAEKMVAAGALDERVGPVKVTSMFGLHGAPQLPVGTLASKAGPMMAATDHFSIKIEGRGGHAAMPHDTDDPITCAAQVVSVLQTIVSRNVDPTDPAVLSITAIDSGNSYNIIPTDATLKGTTRFVRKQTGDLLHRRVCEVAEQTAKAMRCRVQVIWHNGYPVTSNHADAWATMSAVAKGVLGDDRVLEMPAPIMAAEDFSYYGQSVPACFAFLGIRPVDQQKYPDLHTPQFDFNDDAIAHGVKLLCRLALGS